MCKDLIFGQGFGVTDRWGIGDTELEEPHMKRKVLRLSHSPNTIKDVNAQLVTTTSGKLAEDLLKLVEQLKQWWKIKSSHGDVGFKYT
nr:hypothetical protein CFP56_54804 [Quercus suber]POF12551.1 hypothetical protein CFP56_62263 [Quercus suber]